MIDFSQFYALFSMEIFRHWRSLRLNFGPCDQDLRESLSDEIYSKNME